MTTSSDDKYIGTARMEEDGTINMQLKAIGEGIVGFGKLTYAKDHPNYAEILEHLGPMKPGAEVLVKPFPD